MSSPVLPPPSTAISTSYSYGPFGVLNQVVVTPRSGGKPATLSASRYDHLGRRVDFLEADSGETATTYNAFGEPVTEVDANGQTHILSRDTIGRVFADFSTQDGLSFLQWDTAGHGIGKVGAAVAPDAITTSYEYNAFSQPMTMTYHITGSDYAIKRTLDGFGRVSGLQYPAVGGEQFSVTFQPDAVGDISSVLGSGQPGALNWAAMTWEPDGQLTEETFSQGAKTSRVYNPQRGWLTNIDTNTSAESVQKLQFDYDPNGNLKKRDDALQGTSETFQHDFLNRVGTWAYTSSGGTWNTAFKYDNLGNIQSRSTTGPTTASLAYTAYGTRDAGGTRERRVCMRSRP